MSRNRARSAGPAALACLLLVAGCAYDHPPYAPRLDPSLGRLREDGVGVVDLLYATDRAPLPGDAPARRFGGQRSRALTLGACQISIPLNHARGRCEEAGALQSPDARRHVTMLGTAPAEQPDEFMRRLRARLQTSRQRAVLIFVHGYAVTFEQAATRFAQIAHDLEFDGVPILFSWPTQGSLMSYFVDGSNAEWSARYLSDFLAELIEHSGTERIHILAHSLGARVLSYAVRNLAADHPDQARADVLDQIILAAADMDAEVFERDFARHYARLARRITMYVSLNDWALFSAQRINGYARLGVDGFVEGALELYHKFDVIDATRADRGVVGHVYYGSSPDVLDDLCRVLSGAPPEQGRLRRHFVYLLAPGPRAPASRAPSVSAPGGAAPSESNRARKEAAAASAPGLSSPR